VPQWLRSFVYAHLLITGSREAAETISQGLLQADRDNILRALQSQIRSSREPSTLVIQCELEKGPLTTGPRIVHRQK
jgi:hypothetical protein